MKNKKNKNSKKNITSKAKKQLKKFFLDIEHTMYLLAEQVAKENGHINDKGCPIIRKQDAQIACDLISQAAMETRLNNLNDDITDFVDKRKQPVPMETALTDT